MKAAFYPKLAVDSIRKNKRMYFPYILTCIGMVMMYYIIEFLVSSDTISLIKGGETIQMMLEFGGGVIAFFSCIFLFYTNSFLIRRRKKEFGLYNILGMGKRNIGIILFWEVLIIAVGSVTIGLVAGIAFSKLAELGLVNMMRDNVSYTLSFSLQAIKSTLKVFTVIFVLLYLNALRQVKFSTAISLLRSENVGEKPPKGNWFVGIMGILILGAAYYLAVTIKEPLAAIEVFFIAVIMVIAATYMIMIAGSVVVCRILQKSKKYYYKSNHFISVSSMVYRMKRNGAGLASICILATMVLVMISSTAAVYFGKEDSLKSRFPREINANAFIEDVKQISEDAICAYTDKIEEIAGKHGITPENISTYREAYIAGMLIDDKIETDVRKVNSFNAATFSDVLMAYIIPLKDYNAAMGTNEVLGEGEALIYTYRMNYANDTIGFYNGQTFHIQKQVDDFMDEGDFESSILPTIALVVPDFENAIQGLDTLTDFNGDRMLRFDWDYNFDTGLQKEEQYALLAELQNSFRELDISGEFPSTRFDSREQNKDYFYGTYTGLFYLGIILSVVFLFATVLIIYYKQVSEGYEDRSRFEIMQKVGITKKEIRRSINSQLLTVFFLPLIGAGCHLAFAFPIIRKLILMFGLNNVPLFVGTTVGSFLIFALFYIMVYRMTSNAYYNIVSGAKEE